MDIPGKGSSSLLYQILEQNGRRISSLGWIRDNGFSALCSWLLESPGKSLSDARSTRVETITGSSVAGRVHQVVST